MKKIFHANLKILKNIPTIFVIFGASGDLMQKKVVPALFHLFRKGELPTRFKIVGLARGEFSQAEFQKYVFEILNKHKDIKVETCGQFCQLLTYQKGLFQSLKDYRNLGKFLKEIDNQWGVCSNKLFYLAVPPKFYKTIFKNLAASGLTKPCSPEEGWTRLLVEKPFGKDLKTAQELEDLLHQLFKEVQIYRIDHYLAKEMIQNILIFRFSNNLFECQWSKEGIKKIEIKLLEKIGVEKRGSFYDSIGALRDVGQNHLLQMLALVTMEHPINFEANAVRSKRAEILQALSPLTQKEIRDFTFRAQYEGYRNIKGVRTNSETETYFKIRAYIDSPEWKGVPIFMESGKRMKESRKEIIITFKHPSPCLCPFNKKEHYTNKVVIRWEPKEEIIVRFWSKKPGLKMETEERIFNFFYRDTANKTQYTEEYEKLLLDAVQGEQTLFVSSDEVKAMWRFIDPILIGWQKNLVPLRFYKPHSEEILAEAEAKFSKGSRFSSVIRKKEIGIVGLGKMGANLARQLREKGWQVYGYNRDPKKTKAVEREGIYGIHSLKQLPQKLSRPRVIWLMITAGKAVDEVINELRKYLKKGDIIIDGGNSFYKDSVKRYAKLKRVGIHFIDVGVSGGPEGARVGASLMIGGDKKVFNKLEPLFYDLARKGGYQFLAGAGAGHFVKMIHNGIEYGMMQAIAEGFTILKKSKYNLDLTGITDVYNHGSVIESRLVGWLKEAFELYGEDLTKVSGSVGHTGEGEWTVKTAKEMNIKTKIIEGAVNFRIESEKHPSYTGKILSALRGQFGQHQILKK